MTQPLPECHRVAFSRSGKMLACASLSTVVILRIPDMETVFRAKLRWTSQLVFSDSGSHLGVALGGGRVLIVDIGCCVSRDVRGCVGGDSSIAFAGSSGDERLAIGNSNGWMKLAEVNGGVCAELDLSGEVVGNVIGLSDGSVYTLSVPVTSTGKLEAALVTEWTGAGGLAPLHRIDTGVVGGDALDVCESGGIMCLGSSFRGTHFHFMKWPSGRVHGKSIAGMGSATTGLKCVSDGRVFAADDRGVYVIGRDLESATNMPLLAVHGVAASRNGRHVAVAAGGKSQLITLE